MKLHTIQLNIGDFINGTSHMNATELGAYMRLLVKHYAMGSKGIPSDEKQLSRIAGLTLDKWRKVSSIVLEKFSASGENLTQHRVLLELETASRKSASNRDNALKRNKSDKANAQASLDIGNAIQDTRYKIQNTSIKKLNKKDDEFILPEWVPKTEWAAWMPIRISKKAKNTPYALNLAVRELNNLVNQGENASDVLNQSIMRGYSGLFPTKKDQNNGNFRTNSSASIHQPSRDADQRRREGLANSVARLEARDAARLAGKLES